jgi:hypothetical protein
MEEGLPARAGEESAMVETAIAEEWTLDRGDYVARVVLEKL